MIKYLCGDKILKSGVARSSDKSLYIFLRDFHSDFSVFCNSLSDHQQRISVPYFPHSHQYLLSVALLILALRME